MTKALSKPIETLVGDCQDGSQIESVDVLIVGSGYAASMAALQLAGPDRKVMVLERGRAYAQNDFPSGLGDLPGHVRYRWHATDKQIGYPDALFDLRIGKEVDVLVGSGLGGTSLINANVAERPPAGLMARAAWPKAFRNDPQLLDDDLDLVERLLAVGPGPASPPKLHALERIHHAIPAEDRDGSGTDLRAAVSVCFDHVPDGSPRFAEHGATAVPNGVGVGQPPCTGCGNCVTGCRVGAKGSLDTNLIPLAHARGAKFYTGATVMRVEKHEGDWRVLFRCTAGMRNAAANEEFWILAKRVVLAAGTLGSSEILLRSQAASPQLRFSSTLGCGFSTNGDGIAMSHGQANPVGAVVHADPTGSREPVGQTICGVAHVRGKDPDTGADHALTIEDGAVPAALAGLFGELNSFGAMAQRLGNNRRSAWALAPENAGADPLAANAAAIDHAQCLLIMGDDGAAGRLHLRYPANPVKGNRHDLAHVEVHWPGAADNPTLRSADALLADMNCAAGLDGGQYVPNPAWRALPYGSGELGDALPGGRVLTVHPLGGCAMGDDRTNGVVDHAGRVFDAAADDPGAIHPGLLVLDGAILPTAIGTNPFLTIAALASRAARMLREELGWPASDVWRVSERTLVAAPPDPKPQPVMIELTEKMVGQLDDVPGWLRRLDAAHVEATKRDPEEENSPDPARERWTSKDAIVLSLVMRIDDLDQWLRAPTPLSVNTAKLFLNPLNAKRRARLRPETIPDDHLAGRMPVFCGTGKVSLMEVDRADGLNVLPRMFGALAAYSSRRESLWRLLLRSFSASGGETWVSTLVRLSCVARQHADYRRFRYVLDFDTEIGPVRLEGEKRLAWAPGKLRVFDALADMPLRLTLEGASPAAQGQLSADLLDMADGGAPQATSMPHLPALVQGMAQLGGFFARGVLGSCMWEFGAPDYPRQRVPRRTGPLPLKTRSHGPVHADQCVVRVPLRDLPGSRHEVTMPIVLTRYAQPPGAEAKPVLLVHGLAQGHYIFTHDSMPANMATALWEAGFDVWLVDHRLSNLLPEPISSEGWSIEEIGRFDLPAALAHVRAVTGDARIGVFAHCVGATGLAMGLLGRHDDGSPWIPSDWISAVAINAIHPRIKFSLTNRLRMRLGTVMRDALPPGWLDPVPSVSPSATERLIDRLAFALARFRENRAGAHPHGVPDGFEEAICDRMTLLYGRMWRHDRGMLNPSTHAKFHELLGPAPSTVYRHLYYLAQRGRITDREGQNLFFVEDRVAKCWRFPTLFVHGEESEVFNPRSPDLSRISLDAALNGPPGKALPPGAIMGSSGVILSNVVRTASAGSRLPRTPVGSLRLKAHGHMDPILGDHAAVDFFPKLIKLLREGSIDEEPSPPELKRDDLGEDESDGGFCRKLIKLLRDRLTGVKRSRSGLKLKDISKNDPDSPDMHASARMFRPRIGPIVRAAWRIGTDRIRLRCWVELNLLGTSQPTGVNVGDGWQLLEAWQIVPEVPECWLVDVCTEHNNAGHLPQITAFFGPSQGAQRSAAKPEEALDSPPWLARLATARPARSMRFLVGSCRYPATPFDQRHAYRILDGMGNHVDDRAGRDGVDMVFFVGDQIYADATAELLDADDWRERYLLRYQHAFETPAFRRSKPVPVLFKRLPVHFAVDDHEFSDNWSGRPPRDREGAIRHRKARLAARAYMGSGRETLNPGGRRAGSLWYALQDGSECACPAFVLDTRSERTWRGAGMDAYQADICGKGQLDALLVWLKSFKRDDMRPKFIFAGVVLAPLRQSLLDHPATWRNEDGWVGYPASLVKLIAAIVDHEIQNVVFVGGDLHLSAVAILSLRHHGRRALAWQLVSSGLYAPLPFANARPADIGWTGAIAAPLPEDFGFEYQSWLLSDRTSQFMRVDAVDAGGQWRLDVKVCDAEGRPVPPTLAAELRGLGIERTSDGVGIRLG